MYLICGALSQSHINFKETLYSKKPYISPHHPYIDQTHQLVNMLEMGLYDESDTVFSDFFIFLFAYVSV